MLNAHVKSPVSLARLEATPCWPYLDGYTDWLAGCRYRSSLIQLYLFGIVPLGQWLVGVGLVAEDFDHLTLRRFREHRADIGQWRHRNGKIKAAFRGAQRFHEYLALIGAATGAPNPALLVRPLQRDFERWMSTHRGVCDVTLAGYAPYLSRFLDRLGEDASRYTVAGVRRFVLEAGNGPAGRTATTSATASAVRRFLHFLVATGQCSSTLPAAVPRMASWRLAALPTCLPAADIVRLIDSCVERPLTARRDRAALLLLWRLALRAGDVAGLELADVDWREARIRLTGKSRREIWLPLAQDVGDSLVDYLHNERPDIDCSRLFVKSIAPSGPIDSRTVSWIVRRAIARTGIDAPAGGAHLIRRSAATDMLRQGATLDQIGAVLRHENRETTQLYAKVDQALLADVASCWPCGADAASPTSVNALTLAKSPESDPC